MITLHHMRPLGRLYTGDALAALPLIDAGTVQTCITSPPYWALRDYGDGKGIGLEATPDEWVEALVSVFRRVRRVLRDDGTLWLNVGDCYATQAGHGQRMRGGPEGDRWSGVNGGHVPPNRLKIDGVPKGSLVGLPWRLALALQVDGWVIRSDVIWSKCNPRPESVQTRPTVAHEYLFLLSKQASGYQYNADAIREPATYTRAGREEYRGTTPPGAAPHGGLSRAFDAEDGRNARTVWEFSVSAGYGGHPATFPEKLVDRCVLATSSPGDLVLDPFMGSGTTAAVAQARGRRWVGIEMQERFVSVVEQRTSAPQLAEVGR